MTCILEYKWNSNSPQRLNRKQAKFRQANMPCTFLAAFGNGRSEYNFWGGNILRGEKEKVSRLGFIFFAAVPCPRSGIYNKPGIEGSFSQIPEESLMQEFA